MHFQSFTADSLYRLLGKKEKEVLLSLFSDEKMIKNKISEISNKILECNYQLSFVCRNSFLINGHKKGSFEFIVQNLILRHLYENIKIVYSINYGNRNQIIRQVIVLLKDTYPLYIHRFDIHSFYESISPDELLRILENESRLSYTSISILKNIFDICRKEGLSGLPRGLSISSALSEVYLDSFDFKIQKISGIYYYARYVDDIILFTANKKTKNDGIQLKISEELGRLKLSLNQTKTQIVDDNELKNKDLNYLGYSFSDKGNKELVVKISENKINKIKTRLIKSFISYLKKPKYDLLKKRILFLVDNSSFYDLRSGREMRTGLRYSYQYVNDSVLEQLKDLDLFYHHILHCKNGKFGNKLKSCLSLCQIRQLEKYSFIAGYKNNIIRQFSFNDIASIKEIWK